jgi:hypothetical protein
MADQSNEMEMVERVKDAIEQRRLELGAQPLNRVYGELARAAIEAMAEADPAKGFWQDWAARRLTILSSNWLRAAKRALDGDMRDLQIRVRQAEDPPVAIVASAFLDAALSHDEVKG